ncbi:DUF4998 domain-containing protein [Pedobacter metabolipauper]|uniref:Uncharacterized protein DUF4998 n=1 Tax=Pedobacter metabolipauper TaxID=425513 RepID=A0A4V3D1J9_9SPHI|nr:DUF4998 domain-containing protein [Pedobacter metabolipauper]TDQ11513.1 uncharacterized protein DUF4998 [Pedobacter metabolipauper]
MNIKTLKLSLLFLASAFLMLTASCEKMGDTYSDYLKGGEITYPGKADSLAAFPGNQRIALQWLIMSDPKVVKGVVYWNNHADSVVVPIQKTSKVDTIKVILPNMEESLYTFEVYTYDKSGNRSIGSQVIGEVFGESYQKTISNRLIKSVSWLNLPLQGTTPAFKGAEITWYGVNAQAIFLEIEYIKEDGTIVKLREEPVRAVGRPPLFRETTRLPNCKVNSTIKYRTAFVPDPLAIDTFYTEIKQYN